MSDGDDARDGEAGASIPPPSSWVPAEARSEPADEWLISPSPDTPPTPDATSPEITPGTDEDPWTPPTASVPLPAPTPEQPPAAGDGSRLDVPAPLTDTPRLPWDDQYVRLPDEPVGAPTPGVEADGPWVPVPAAESPETPLPAPVPDPVPAPTPFPEPEPVPEPTPFPEPISAPAPSEPTPTAFETVTESTFTSEPEPAVAFAAQGPSPDSAGKVAAVASEHPEYLIAAALIGGFILAKVVKKLAG